MTGFTRLAWVTASLVLGWSQHAFADDLAKASQNPVGDLISVPFELSYFGDMPGESSAVLLLAKPVYPINLGGVNRSGSPGGDGGFGLFSLRSRSEELGGELRLGRIKGGGTMAVLCLPLPKSAPGKR